MNIILLGAPGSGKGTQAELLVQHHNFVQLSTGDLFRKHIAENTPLGIEAKKFMNEGNLVPDEVTNEMVWDYLSTQRNDGLIFDGYPRTIQQAEQLDWMLAKLNRRINHAFYIEVPNEILIERISNRLVCPTCKRSYNLKTRPPKVAGICDYDGTKLVQRPDDEPEKVAIRLRAYEEQTAPLVDYYRQKETIIHVNGQSTNPEDVYAKINEYLMS